ncbi:MAG: BNR-4 repeat-containing protein [Nanoarchaeota archaeon]
MMKKAVKKKLNKKNLVIGSASVVVIILLLTILIVSDRENVVGNAISEEDLIAKLDQLSAKELDVIVKESSAAEKWALVGQALRTTYGNIKADQLSSIARTLQQAKSSCTEWGCDFTGKNKVCKNLNYILNCGKCGCFEGKCISPEMCAPKPVCGDGIITQGMDKGELIKEECDDGNTNPNDACTYSYCTKAKCGDGYVWKGKENCDDGVDNGKQNKCNLKCTGITLPPELDPTLGAVYTPIFFKQFYQGEREQFGYNPKFVPNTVTFDLNNRPYIRTHDGILQILQDTGTWKKVDLIAQAKTSFYKKMAADPSWAAQWHGWPIWCPIGCKKEAIKESCLNTCPHINDPVMLSGEQNDERVVFDNSGDAYTILHTAAASNLDSAMLLHSKDGGLTWEVYPIKNSNTGYDVRLEHQDGSNQLNSPPGILVYAHWNEGAVAKSKLEYIDINKNLDGTLQLNDNVPIANDFSFLGIGPSSFPNYMVTYGDLTHIIYMGGKFQAVQKGEDIVIEAIPGNPNYVQYYIKTYDHKTKTLSKEILLGDYYTSAAYTNYKKLVPELAGPVVDDHDYPTICVDSKGVLHVILGAHGRQFQYTHSLKSNDISAWSAPVGIGEPDGPNPLYPGSGIMSGEYSYPELICDAQDTIHLVARSSGIGNNYKLVYLRKQAGKNWDTFMPPTYILSDNTINPNAIPGESLYFGKSGMKHKTLLYPWHIYYGNWYHKFNLDRNGKLFVNYIFYSDDLFSDEAAAYQQKWPTETLVKDDPNCIDNPSDRTQRKSLKYPAMDCMVNVPPGASEDFINEYKTVCNDHPCWYSKTVRAHDPAIIMSEDGGNTWRLTTTPDFLKGIKKN